MIKSSSALVGLTRRTKKTRLLTMPGYGAINDIVTLCYHATGQPLAQRSYSEKRTTANCP
ncbi:MAG: hypothetical protein IZT59_09065 [Verrucomicrobia bacterium]|nr:hypothetical protein [Verrucomicrobiota bacterium]